MTTTTGCLADVHNSQKEADRQMVKLSIATGSCFSSAVGFCGNQLSFLVIFAFKALNFLIRWLNTLFHHSQDLALILETQDSQDSS